jgi:hypothetical protein
LNYFFAKPLFEKYFWGISANFQAIDDFFGGCRRFENAMQTEDVKRGIKNGNDE